MTPPYPEEEKNEVHISREELEDAIDRIWAMGRRFRRRARLTLTGAPAKEDVLCPVCGGHIGIVSIGQAKTYCSKACRKQRKSVK